jgi:hypothetical protein
MRPGPTMSRPDTPVETVAERMGKRGVSAVLVTTSDGRLVGLLYQEPGGCGAAGLRAGESFREWMLSEGG